VLDATESFVSTQRSTGKEPLTDDDVSRLLASADTVVVARGRSRQELVASEVDFALLKGPTGKYRAPMVLTAGTLLVGFNAEALNELLSG